MLVLIFPVNEDSGVQQDGILGIHSPSLSFAALWGAPSGARLWPCCPAPHGWEGRAFPNASLPFSCAYN